MSFDLSSKIIKIEPLDFAKFLSGDLTIWKGPADGGGFSGEEDVCLKSLSLAEVELSKFIFKNYLEEGEASIGGEERMRRLNGMSDFIGFGPNVFLGLWYDYQANKENKENSALEWLHRNFGVTVMDFPGAVLRLIGYRVVLCLFRYADGSWGWYYGWLGDKWGGDCSSVGYAS